MTVQNGRPTSPNSHGPISAASETTPLLATASANQIASTQETPGLLADEPTKNAVSVSAQSISSSSGEEDKPLPMGQIFLLCYARLVEPIAFFSIFPFVNQMIWETGGLTKEEVGFYTGLIESLFSLTQMLLMIPWGYAADRVGRKPVLVFSLFGVSIATALFGLSKTLWQMILFRCLAGMFAGTIVTVRTMITENSTSKTQARAFSFFAFTGNIGILLGPLVGGPFSEPAKQFPSVFGNVQLFIEYPYLLPTLVTGSFGLVAVVISALFIKETLVPIKASDNGAPPPKPMTTRELLGSPGVSTILSIYGITMFLAFAYTAVAPVFWFTPAPLGGFGFTPMQISMMLSVAGASQAIWMLFVFPPFHSRVGTEGMLRILSVCWPISFVIAPILNLFLRNGMTTTFWTLLFPTQILGAGIAMIYTAVQLSLNEISPSPQVLGTMNAIALTLTSGTRAITPASITPIFAFGVKNHILGGLLIWVFLIGVCLILAAVIYNFYPKKTDGSTNKATDPVAEDEE